MTKVEFEDEDGNVVVAYLNPMLPKDRPRPTPEEQARLQAEWLVEREQFVREMRVLVERYGRLLAARRAVRSLMECLPSPSQQKPSDLN